MPVQPTSGEEQVRAAELIAALCLASARDAEITAELFDEGGLLTHFNPVMFGSPAQTIARVPRDDRTRPHREAFSPAQAADLLGEEARAGRLDPDSVAAVVTADRHIQNTYAKTGVSSRAAMTLFAMQHGLAASGELPMSRIGQRS